MNPRERMLRALRGQATDRVPLELPGLEYSSRDELADVKDPLRRAIAERVIGVTAFRVQVPSRINRMLITPPQRIRSRHEDLPDGHRQTVGVIDTPLGELTYVTEWDPESQTTWMRKYSVEDESDIEKIASVPWELPADLEPPNRGKLPDEFSERGLMVSHVSSPFVCVAGAMKFEQFLELCITAPDLIAELTKICTQRTLDCLKVLLSKPGIDCIWMGGSEWVTPPMASPRIYDALVQEQERRIIQYVREHSDAVVHVHCHGRIRDALPKMIRRGADYTEPVEPPPDGDVTMTEAKEIAAGRITLGGNIESRVLCRESEGTVEDAVRAAFEGEKERFILRPTEGPSPRLSEKEFGNHMRLIDVWEQLSPIG